jgi:drug/metabolite transporter (DMT)-like permease
VIAAGACALGAASCFAVCSVMQHRANAQVESSETLGAGILLRLLRRPLFLAATVIELAGLGLQTVALGLGALIVVQPLLVLGLLLAVPLSAVLDHRPLLRLEVVGAALTVIGLGTFLTAAQPSEGIDVVHLSRALPVAGLLVVVTAICVLVSQRDGAHRGVWLGLASGALYGVSSGLIKVVASHFGDIGLRVVEHWPFWAMIAIGAAGLILTQHAFAAGGLGAPLAVLTLAEPVAAVIVGRFVLDEHLAGGVGPIFVEVLGALVAGWGVWMISTQPGARVRLPVTESLHELVE